MTRKLTVSFLMLILFAFFCNFTTLAQDKTVAEKWTELPGKTFSGKPWKQDPAGKIFHSADGDMLKFMVKGNTWKFDIATEKIYFLGKNGMWLNKMTKSILQRNKGSILVIKMADERFKLTLKSPHKPLTKLSGLTRNDDLPGGK